jgi:CHASE3 domain sensor protein
LHTVELLQRRTDAALDRLDALVPSPGLSRYGIDALAALARDREQFAAEIIASVQRGDLGEARLLLQGGQDKTRTEAVRTTIASLQTEARRVLSLETRATARSRGVFLAALWLSGSVAVLLLLLAARTVLPGGLHRRGPLRQTDLVKARQSL